MLQLMGGQLQPDLAAVGLDNFVEAVKSQAGAGELRPVIRRRELLRLPVYGTSCQHCDHPGLCWEEAASERLQ